MLRTFLKGSALCALVLCACDLQPKIASIPDDIGMFIEDRYPALLADPETQPEIYNSAVTDYGVYASPELYGSSSMDDYVLYASVDDYVLVPESQDEVEVAETKIINESEVETEQENDYLVIPVYAKNDIPDEKTAEPKKEFGDVIIVAKGDTVYSLARKNNMSIDEFAKINNLKEPYTLSIGQKLTTTRKAEVVAAKKEAPKVVVEKAKEAKVEKVVVKEPVKPTDTKRVDLQEITVQKGDTLYSLSRKYEIPVNDLAVMNKISSPFDLTVGQKIKVPKLDNVKTASVSEIKTVSVKPSTSATAKITPAKKVVRQATVKETKPTTTIKETKTATVAKNTVVKTQNSTTVKNTVKNAPQKTVVAKTVKQEKISSNPKKQLPKVAARSSSKFSWPVRGKILSAYGAKNNGLFNDGINIAASQGTIVKAAENGVVAYAGNEVKGMGNLIIIQHSDGWMTVYAHLDSMSVKRGARVNVGTPIGRVGKTGKVDQPQLHFEIRKGTKAYNPTKYLKN